MFRNISSVLFILVLVASAFAQKPKQAPAPTPTPDDKKNVNQSIWTLDVSKFRREHALEGGYTKQFDLSDMPHYMPKQQVTGTLRIWGSNYLKDGPLGELWRDAFKKFQPGITIEYNLPTA